MAVFTSVSKVRTSWFRRSKRPSAALCCRSVLYPKAGSYFQKRLEGDKNMKASDHIVLAHHQPAATMWGRGGRDYDDVSFAISDALAHSAQRLNARKGERILDVATGTGW